MSVDIKDNLTLLSTILPQGAAAKKVPSGESPRDTMFAERLNRVLSGANTETAMPQVRPEVLAETLSLQMLQTSLSLGEGSTENPTGLFERQSSQLQALIKAYAANQPPEETAPVQPPAPQSQLREMAESAPIEPVRAALPATHPGQGFESIISKAANRYGVDAGLIKAVIKAESSFNPNAVSHAGAQGLMQLMPGTARSLGVNDSFDPEQNIMGGTRFLRDLLKRYNGNLDSALAAYNWGPGNVDKRPGQLPRETRDYLARVKQLYNSYTA